MNFLRKRYSIPAPVPNFQSNDLLAYEVLGTQQQSAPSDEQRDYRAETLQLFYMDGQSEQVAVAEQVPAAIEPTAAAIVSSEQQQQQQQQQQQIEPAQAEPAPIVNIGKQRRAKQPATKAPKQIKSATERRKSTQVATKEVVEQINTESVQEEQKEGQQQQQQQQQQQFKQQENQNDQERTTNADSLRINEKSKQISKVREKMIENARKLAEELHSTNMRLDKWRRRFQ